jgi:hypothetical protein
MAGQDLVEEMLDRAAVGIATGRRFVFWPYHAKVFAGLARLIGFLEAGFCLVSDWASPCSNLINEHSLLNLIGTNVFVR